MYVINIRQPVEKTLQRKTYVKMPGLEHGRL